MYRRLYRIHMNRSGDIEMRKPVLFIPNNSMVFGLRCRLLTRDKKGARFLIKFTLTKRRTNRTKKANFGVRAARR